MRTPRGERAGEQASDETAQVTRRWVEHTFPRFGVGGAAVTVSWSCRAAR